MKKIFVKCGLNHNLGDDLFLYIVARRYEDKAYFSSITNCKEYQDYSNVEFHYIPYKIYDIANKVARILKFGNIFDWYYIRKSDMYLVIGGSIFMENIFTRGILSVMYYFHKNRFILGSNIGPYHSEEYLKFVKKIFVDSNDVCLRDKESFNLVRDLKNVRYAPDIIFSLDVTEYLNMYRRRVIVSVINYHSKSNQFNISYKENTYYDNIVALIKKFSQDYEIALMSFCEKEGDMKAIDIIQEMLPDEIKTNITVYNYKGNIDETLKFLANSEIIIGSRFHANVLGFLLEKKVIPIVYNDKTRNLLKDIDFSNFSIDLNDNKIIELEKLEKEYIYPDLKEYIKDSAKHFEVLDAFMVERSGSFDRNL